MNKVSISNLTSSFNLVGDWSLEQLTLYLIGNYYYHYYLQALYMLGKGSTTELCLHTLNVMIAN
jgi:hypothetical protein